MATVMAEKLVEAGVAVPTQAERLWRVIKDNPGITAIRAGELTRIVQSNASSVICGMYKRGMLLRDYEWRKVLRNGGKYTDMNVAVYRVAFDDYEVLPYPKAPKKPEVAAPSTPVPAPVEVSTTVIKAPTVAQAGAFIDSMTVAEARELYRLLHEMFGGKA